MTEDRRKELVKEAKISILNARKEANNQVIKVEGIADDLVKNTEFDIQNLTDKYIKTIDRTT